MSRNNSEKQDIPMPESFMRRQKEFEQLYENFQEAKKLSERYVSLKRRLETCREVKSCDTESLKDQKAISYFESCQGQIQKKLDDIESAIKNYRDRYEKELQRLEKVLQYQVEQEEMRKAKINSNLVFIQTRLAQAKERAENQSHRKTKEEIAIEKEIREMIPKYCELQPNSDLNQAFPDYKKLLGLPEENQPPQPPPPPTPSTPVSQPPPPPPVSKAKRKAKVVEVTEPPVFEEIIPEPNKDNNPLAMMSDKDIAKLSQAELWKYVHPDKPSPFDHKEEEEEQPEDEEEEEPAPRFQYPKIVSNSKLPLKAKRAPKA